MWLAATTLCFGLCPGGTALAQAPALSSRLEALTPRARAQDALRVRYTVKNDGGETVRLLKWATPLEGRFNARLFEVEKDGKKVAYIGRLVKRENPTEADFETLEPGASASAELDLSQGYALGEPGHYTVRLSRKPLEVHAGAPAGRPAKPGVTLREVGGNAIEIELLEPRALPAQPPAAALRMLTLEEAKKTPKAKQAAYEGCSASQQSQIDDALSHSANLAAGAYISLAVTPTAKRAAAPRYLTWFGTYTATRYSTVETHFQKIQSALANETVTFHCDCSDAGVYAYVYPGSPYHIHLCPVFWTAPLDGTDSKAGTIIHETSHFTVTAGTDDHVYGQSGCKSLATTDPDSAIDNADSHEYFAENNPAQAMGSDAIVALVALVLATILVERLLRRRRTV